MCEPLTHARVSRVMTALASGTRVAKRWGVKFPQGTVVLSCLAMCACDGITGGLTTTDAGADPADNALNNAVMSLALGYKTFSKCDAKPYASTVGAFDINLYVSGDVHDFQSIHPESPGTNVTISTGTIIVREVLDATGATTKLTLMAKGPPGYDPTLGDWWFGVLTPEGIPMLDDGQPALGRLDDCHGCHIPRATDDYLFGVPKADQPHH